MKYFVLLFVFVFNTTIAQETYYSENFQSITLPINSTSSDMPEGWDNYNLLDIVRLKGENQFIVFRNFAINTIFGIGSPELLINENTKLKFKIAVSDKKKSGTFKIKLIKGVDMEEIASFNFDDIVRNGINDSDFTAGEPDSKFEKEVDLSAYAGQKLQFHFEMFAEQPYVWLFLDDLKLVSDRTMVLNDHSKERVAVYPNPVDNYFTISLNGGAVKENQLYALDGRLVKAIGNSDTIWIGDLPKGIYLVKVTDDSGNQYTHKIVKK